MATIDPLTDPVAIECLEACVGKGHKKHGVWRWEKNAGNLGWVITCECGTKGTLSKKLVNERGFDQSFIEWQEAPREDGDTASASTSEVLKFARRMAGELRQLEWEGCDWEKGTLACWWCVNEETDGHAPGCEWVVLMEQAKRLGLVAEEKR